MLVKNRVPVVMLVEEQVAQVKLGMDQERVQHILVVRLDPTCMGQLAVVQELVVMDSIHMKSLVAILLIIG